MSKPADDEVDRLEKLLDLALATLKGGDEEGALLILQEANVSAEKLPKAVKPKV
jgi:hypothetical protein